MAPTVKVSLPVAVGAALLLTGSAVTGLRGQAPTTFIVESPTMLDGAGRQGRSLWCVVDPQGMFSRAGLDEA